MLEYPWDLSPCDAAPTADDLKALDAAMRAAGSGEIDVNEQQGKVFSRFLPDLQRDLGLVWQPENWDEVRLAAWLCRNLPEPSLTHVSKLAFVAAWLKDLRRRGGFALSRVNLQKFLIRDRLEARIRELRGQAAKQAYQQALFGENAARRSATNTPLSSPLSFTRPAAIMMIALASLISTSIITDASATSTARKNSSAPVNWMRNLVRREGCSFFLQKADGRFYPDFLCQLPEAKGQAGAVLAVEYKGADRWGNAEDDRLIGGLWASLSDGRCRFVMVKNKRWDWIESALAPDEPRSMLL